MYNLFRRIGEYLGIEFSTDQRELDDFFYNIDQTKKDFAKYLFNQMKTRNLNPDKLAVQIGTSRKNVFNYLHGKSLPRKKTMKKICEYFGISEEDLESLI